MKYTKYNITVKELKEALDRLPAECDDLGVYLSCDMGGFEEGTPLCEVREDCIDELPCIILAPEEDTELADEYFRAIGTGKGEEEL